MDGEWEPPMIDNPEFKVSHLITTHLQNIHLRTKCANFINTWTTRY